MPAIAGWIYSLYDINLPDPGWGFGNNIWRTAKETSWIVVFAGLANKCEMCILLSKIHSRLQENHDF